MESFQGSQLVAGPVSPEVIRACLVHLGWRVDFADDCSIVAELITKGIGHQEFSVSVTWQAQLSNVLVNVRVVKKTNNPRAESACEQQVKRIIEKVRQRCGEAKQESPSSAKRWAREF